MRAISVPFAIKVHKPFRPTEQPWSAPAHRVNGARGAVLREPHSGTASSSVTWMTPDQANAMIRVLQEMEWVWDLRQDGCLFRESPFERTV